MYQDNHGQGKSSEELSLKTSLLEYSSLSSVSGSQADQIAFLSNQEKIQENPELQDDDSSSTGNADTSVQYVDGNSFNRYTIRPYSMIITRVFLDDDLELPFVESTDLGQVAYCQLKIVDGVLSVVVAVATKKSARNNNPKWHYIFEPEIKRLEVGAEGLAPLIDHDFESGQELRVNGESVLSILVDGGYLDTDEGCDAKGPRLRVHLKDQPNGIGYEVGFIKLEFKPFGCRPPVLTPLGISRKSIKRGYHQVIQCPNHHNH